VNKTKSAVTKTRQPLSRFIAILPWILIIGGIIGVIASCVITAEKFALAKDATFQPSCDLNPIISCGSVMKSEQANAFGFMNTYIGLLGFPAVVTIGVAMLAGATFARWFWRGVYAGLVFGMGFAYWLLFESMYRIKALCPWCLSVDVALTVIFWYVTLFIFYNGYIKLPARLQRVGDFVKRHHLDIILFWFVLVIALILYHFWYYFGQHI
jgi:uncharacterized membrane protein